MLIHNIQLLKGIFILSFIGQGVYIWSYFDLTRLETRSKESNMDARLCSTNFPTRRQFRSCLSLYQDTVMSPNISSKSIPIGIRKMVNYTCAGLRLEKFRWRFETILTCKSFVGCKCRGERLIELSSSWFPSKFPSG